MQTLIEQLPAELKEVIAGMCVQRTILCRKLRVEHLRYKKPVAPLLLIVNRRRDEVYRWIVEEFVHYNNLLHYKQGKTHVLLWLSIFYPELWTKEDEDSGKFVREKFISVFFSDDPFSCNTKEEFMRVTNFMPGVEYADALWEFVQLRRRVTTSMPNMGMWINQLPNVRLGHNPYEKMLPDE